jgi:hypothetical protein
MMGYEEESRPRCPHCRSFSVVPFEPQTLLLAGIGALLGGLIIGALVLLSNKSSDRSSGSGSEAGPIVSGILSGAVTGITFGQKYQGKGNDWLCLDCFHTFTFFAHDEYNQEDYYQ